MRSFLLCFDVYGCEGHPSSHGALQMPAQPQTGVVDGRIYIAEVPNHNEKDL